jgi:hypothetical protein
MFFGNIHDGNFSERVLKKLTVKQDSFFRKIMPFKKIKGSVHSKYLYIRIIPLILHILMFLILIPMFMIDQLLTDFIHNDFFGYLGIVSIGVFILYNFIMAIIARII